MGRRDRCRGFVECPISPISPVDVINVDCVCIANIDNCFFLLVNLESNVSGVELDSIVAIRLTDSDANRLLRAGVRRCLITDQEPITSRGCPVANFRCVLILNGRAFRVFSNNDNCFILVPTRLCGTSPERCC